MRSVFKAFLAVILLLGSFAAHADTDPRTADRVLGKADAPVKVDEYVSLTCPHCAEFYTDVLPPLEKKYVDTGKVKFIMHDFPIDGVSVKAAAIARCMPADEFYPFIKTLFANQMAWVVTNDPVASIIQYARLGGLSEDKAKECANDAKLQDAIIAERTDAGKFKVEATPTFVINDGVETIKGAQSVETFSATFDRVLAMKH